MFSKLLVMLLSMLVMFSANVRAKDMQISIVDFQTLSQMTPQVRRAYLQEIGEAIEEYEDSVNDGLPSSREHIGLLEKLQLFAFPEAEAADDNGTTHKCPKNIYWYKGECRIRYPASKVAELEKMSGSALNCDKVAVDGFVACTYDPAKHSIPAKAQALIDKKDHPEYAPNSTVKADAAQNGAASTPAPPAPNASRGVAIAKAPAPDTSATVSPPASTPLPPRRPAPTAPATNVAPDAPAPTATKEDDAKPARAEKKKDPCNKIGKAVADEKCRIVLTQTTIKSYKEILPYCKESNAQDTGKVYVCNYPQGMYDSKGHLLNPPKKEVASVADPAAPAVDPAAEEKPARKKRAKPAAAAVADAKPAATDTSEKSAKPAEDASKNSPAAEESKPHAGECKYTASKCEKLTDDEKKDFYSHDHKCIYGGVISEYRGGKTVQGNCSPVQELTKLHHPFRCKAAGRTVCNPLIFGVKPDNEPFCWKRGSNATAQCSKQSKANSQADVEKMMTSLGISDDWKEFRKSIKELCAPGSIQAKVQCKECNILNARLLDADVHARGKTACKEVEKTDAPKDEAPIKAVGDLPGDVG